MINIVIGIVKVKVLAVLLGPAGVGLMGLYQNIVGLASTLVVGGGGFGRTGYSQGRLTADNYGREYRARAGAILTDTRTMAQNLADQATDQTRIVLDAGRDQANSADNHTA